jgi:Ca-activated chloride channel family protein
MDAGRVLLIAVAVVTASLTLVAVLRGHRAARALSAWPTTAAGAVRQTRARALLLVIAAIAGAVAAIGHGPGRERRAPAGRLVPVMFAVDVSRSMDVDDAEPTRRAAATDVMLRLVRRPAALNAGLVVFSGEAILVCPITTDTTAQRLAIAETGVLAETIIGGSALGPAIARALDALPPVRRAAIVLVSDGDDTAGEIQPVLQRAIARGVVVHAVGVGTPEGRRMRVRRAAAGADPGGGERVARLDEQRLREVAAATGGSYVRWDGSDASVRAIERWLADEPDQPPRPLALGWVRASLLVMFVALVFEPRLQRRNGGVPDA